MKVKSPLLSFSASGSLANLITFLNIRGSTYAKTKQGKIGGTSAAQLEQRAKFKAACVASHLLTDEEKLYYHNLDIRSASCSWFNNFMSTFLLEEEAPPESMIESIQHVALTIPDGETSITVTIDAVNVDKTVLIFLGNEWYWYDSSLYMASIELSSSTTVIARVYETGAGEPISAHCIVLEFSSDFVKSRQFISGILLHGYKDISVEIDEVSLDKAIILPAGARHTGSIYPFDFMHSIYFVDSTHVKFRRRQTSGTIEIFATIFEFL